MRKIYKKYPLAHILVPILMILVFLNQVRLNIYGTLNPWRGGGFGMFAAIDSPRERILDCRGITEEGDTAIIILDVSNMEQNWGLERDLLTKLISMPSQSQLDRLAEKLIELNYIRPEESKARSSDSLKKDLLENRKKLYYRPVKRFDYDKKKVIHMRKIALTIWRVQFLNDDSKIYFDFIMKTEKTRNELGSYN